MRVQIRLVATTVSGTKAITSINQNTPFDLIVYVKDMRPAGSYTYNGVAKTKPRGVFSAYVNVCYEMPIVKCLGAMFGSIYENGKIYKDSNGLANVGAFAGVSYGLGTSERELCRLRMKAGTLYSSDTYLAEFWGNFFNLPHPEHDTLVYGLAPEIVDALNLPDEKSYVYQHEITILPTQLKIVP